MHTIKKPRKYKYRTRRNNNKKHSRKFIQKRTTSNRKLNRNRRQTKKRTKKHMEGGGRTQSDELHLGAQEDTTLPEDFCERINKLIKLNRSNKNDNKKMYDKKNAALKKEIEKYIKEFKKNKIKNPELINKMNELCRYTPLITAISYGNIDIVKFLLKYTGIEIDVNIGNPLVHAVENKQYEMVKLLLGHPSIRIEKSKYSTPLRMAVIKRFEDIVKLLLDHYCKDLEKKTKEDIIMYREDIIYSIQMIQNEKEEIYIIIGKLLKEALSKIDEFYPKIQEDVPAGPLEDVPANLEGITPASPPEDVPASPPENTPASPPEDVPASPPEDVPASPPEDVPANLEGNTSAGLEEVAGNPQMSDDE